VGRAAAEGPAGRRSARPRSAARAGGEPLLTRARPTTLGPRETPPARLSARLRSSRSRLGRRAAFGPAAGRTTAGRPEARGLGPGSGFARVTRVAARRKSRGAKGPHSGTPPRLPAGSTYAGRARSFDGPPAPRRRAPYFLAGGAGRAQGAGSALGLRGGLRGGPVRRRSAVPGCTGAVFAGARAPARRHRIISQFRAPPRRLPSRIVAKRARPATPSRVRLSSQSAQLRRPPGRETR